MKTLVLSVAMDQSVGVKQSNNSLKIATGLGALLAGLVVLVFLRTLRMTLVIVLAMPIAILFSIFCLYFRGNTINAMTLGGLTLAIGILIDQSIVVLENVIRQVLQSPLVASWPVWLWPSCDWRSWKSPNQSPKTPTPESISQRVSG